jgi:hypothetical protein
VSRPELAFALALLVMGLAVVRWASLTRRRPSAPTPSSPSPVDRDDPQCRARGCVSPATRALPELRPWRPLLALLPRWETETDPEGEPALCRAHHGALEAALAARAADERAATETHLATRHRELVAWVGSQLCRDHGIAPARPAPRPAESEPAATAE